MQSTSSFEKIVRKNKHSFAEYQDFERVQRDKKHNKQKRLKHNNKRDWDVEL